MSEKIGNLAFSIFTGGLAGAYLASGKANREFEKHGEHFIIIADEEELLVGEHEVV